VQLVHQQCILGVACIFHDVQDQKLGWGQIYHARTDGRRAHKACA
jgi:hypothetical protein